MQVAHNYLPKVRRSWAAQFYGENCAWRHSLHASGAAGANDRRIDRELDRSTAPLSDGIAVRRLDSTGAPGVLRPPKARLVCSVTPAVCASIPATTATAASMACSARQVHARHAGRLARSVPVRAARRHRSLDVSRPPARPRPWSVRSDPLARERKYDKKRSPT